MGDTTGAFADGAVLFPLLIALSVLPGMHGAVLLASTGLAYVIAGLYFRVPMPVQPLKSVAVAALALGASAHEIAAAGFAVGAVCLLLSCLPVDALAARVPRHLVQGLQLALGLLLVLKGGADAATAHPPIIVLLFGLATLGVVWTAHRTTLPVMGWIATAALAWGVIAALFAAAEPTVVPATVEPMRGDIVLALVLPQLALTLTNSVVGTEDAARRYFGERAHRVTSSRLLRSIGVGNVLMAPLGGLPFCHGSGGVTAHVKGGAHTFRANLIIGSVLLALAVGSWALGLPLVPAYPRLALSLLLVGTGVFHVLLAAPSWKVTELRWGLIAMGVVAVVTQNMLWVLVTGIACEALRRLPERRRA